MIFKSSIIEFDGTKLRRRFHEKITFQFFFICLVRLWRTWSAPNIASLLEKLKFWDRNFKISATSVFFLVFILHRKAVRQNQFSSNISITKYFFTQIKKIFLFRVSSACNSIIRRATTSVKGILLRFRMKRKRKVKFTRLLFLEFFI